MRPQSFMAIPIRVEVPHSITRGKEKELTYESALFRFKVKLFVSLLHHKWFRKLASFIICYGQYVLSSCDSADIKDHIS